jgi:hypothetical protein
MKYKITHSHILFNHPHNDYIISVLIESTPGYWKAFYKQMDEISLNSLQEVAREGEKYTTHRALEVFPELKLMNIKAD